VPKVIVPLQPLPPLKPVVVKTPEELKEEI